jgi:hypothetical protein
MYNSTRDVPADGYNGGHINYNRDRTFSQFLEAHYNFDLDLTLENLV